MNDKEWLDKVVEGCTEYNNKRLHTNFQEEEVLKFVEWLHRQHSVEYVKPEATQQNTPEKLKK